MLIAEDIINQDLRKGNCLPSELSYAGTYNVSRLTIRRALARLESQGVISPVKAKRRYVLKDLSRQEKALTIACIGYGHAEEGAFTNAIHMRIFEHMVYEFQKKNVNLTRVIVKPNDPTIPQTVQSNQIDAFIVLGDVELPFIEHIPVPIISLDYRYGSKIPNAICQDGAAIAIDAVQYLYSMGHRRIGFMDHGLEVLYPFQDDLRVGYERGLQLCNAPCKPSVFSPARAVRQNSSLLEQFIKNMLSASPDLDALITCNNNIGIRLINIFSKLGIAIPERLSVLAVGGTDDPGLCAPTLTCYENDYALFVKLFCEYALNFISGNITAPGKVCVKAFTLVERESVISR